MTVVYIQEIKEKLKHRERRTLFSYLIDFTVEKESEGRADEKQKKKKKKKKREMEEYEEGRKSKKK